MDSEHPSNGEAADDAAPASRLEQCPVKHPLHSLGIKIQQTVPGSVSSHTSAAPTPAERLRPTPHESRLHSVASGNDLQVRDSESLASRATELTEELPVYNCIGNLLVEGEEVETSKEQLNEQTARLGEALHTQFAQLKTHVNEKLGQMATVEMVARTVEVVDTMSHFSMSMVNSLSKACEERLNDLEAASAKRDEHLQHLDDLTKGRDFARASIPVAPAPSSFNLETLQEVALLRAAVSSSEAEMREIRRLVDAHEVLGGALLRVAEFHDDIGKRVSKIEGDAGCIAAVTTKPISRAQSLNGISNMANPIARALQQSDQFDVGTVQAKLLDLQRSISASSSKLNELQEGVLSSTAQARCAQRSVEEETQARIIVVQRLYQDLARQMAEMRTHVAANQQDHTSSYCKPVAGDHTSLSSGDTSTGDTQGSWGSLLTSSKAC